MGALKEVVSNRLGGDSLAMWADRCFGAVYAEEVLIEWRVAGTELC